MCALNRAGLYVSFSIIVACLASMLCEATGRFDHPPETGQPRELINQPPCGAIDGNGGGPRCELANQL